MKKVRHYTNYEDYIKFQSVKTSDPAKREKWLGDEWQSKVTGFKSEFSKFGNIIGEETKALCIGARTGQEVAALKEMGVKEAIGVDIVPCEPNVIEGDMHCLGFEDDSFDFVYMNVLDHSINPETAMIEAERVLKVGGYLFLQCRMGEEQDQYTEITFESPIHDILTLTNTTFCVICQPIERNFAGMNFEYVFVKSQELSDLYRKYGNIQTIEVPEDYLKLWDDINLPIQNKKLDSSNIVSNKQRKKILSGLSRRGYYLTRIAESFNRDKIVEIGTAEGWQFYNFCKYVSEKSDSEGFVFSCDPRDVRNRDYAEIFEKDDRFNYVLGTSAEISKIVKGANFFYVDGLHDQGTVIRDVVNLEPTQSENMKSVWVFDDFDDRFGCAQDIFTLCQAARAFKVYKIGKTASGNPAHQAIVLSYFRSE